MKRMRWSVTGSRGVDAVHRHLQGAATLRRLLMAVVLFGFAASAQAQSYPGKQLLEFARNYVIAPVGLFSIVVALAASFFRPDFVRSAIYAAVICAVLFFLIGSAPSLMTALKG